MTKNFLPYPALLTDFYELSMAQGYFLSNHNPQVNFDMYIRKPPFGGAYAIFAGLEELIDSVAQLQFSDGEIEFLRQTGKFQANFLEYLREFSFSGKIYAIPEGSIVFPHTPLITVQSNLLEAQLLESRILNQVNFQSLIATKANRIYNTIQRRDDSKEPKILEFGLRRAQGPDGAISASRAAYIGGAAATSNLAAGALWDIPVTGTMAHSWVMAHADEELAFRKYAEIYPDFPVFLIDTYDALGSGLRAAIRIGREHQAAGLGPIGVRIDSGDLHYLSTQVRRALDQNGLRNARIAVSNDLNENIVEQLISDRAPIDFWGIGTQLSTGGNQAALQGVYKLTAILDGQTWVPTIKISNQVTKASLPGVKQIYRFFDANNLMIQDLIALRDETVSRKLNGPASEPPPVYCYHPTDPYISYKLRQWSRVEPLQKLYLDGKIRQVPPRTPQQIRNYTIEQLKLLPSAHKRLINPHIYKVSLTHELLRVKSDLIAKLQKSAEETASKE